MDLPPSPPLAGVWPDLLEILALARALRNGEAMGAEAHQRFESRLAAVTAAGCRLTADVYGPLLAAIAKGPLTIGQVGQSLDGRVATENGHSRYINGAESLDHLHRLRALADAVVVGASTVEVDDPQLTTRRVAGANPVRVVIDPRRRLGPGARVFNADAPSLRVCVAAADDRDGTAAAILLPRREGSLRPRDILAALHRRGLKTVLIEGGPTTLSAFLAAGALDRLHVIVAPMVLGSGPAGLRLPPIDHVGKALRLSLRVYPLGDDLLFDCRPLVVPAHQIASTSA